MTVPADPTHAVEPSRSWGQPFAPPQFTPPDPESVPLVVDVDGALVQGDLLFEGLVRIAFGPVRHWASVLHAASRGRAALKARVAELVPLSLETLPWNNDVRSAIARALQDGRVVLLASGAAPSWIELIAGYLGVGLIPAAPGVNMVERKKLAAIEERFARFDYIGNSRADLPIWRRARTPIVVNATRLCVGSLRATRADAVVIDRKRGGWRAVVRAMRVHQWSKNLLIFLPALAAHLGLTGTAAVRQVVAFLAFSATASAIYLLNDLADLPLDRAHPTKRKRPLASATLSIPTAFALMVMLVTAAAVLAGTVGGMFPLALAGYAVLSLSYVFALKRRLLVDVVVLALLYATRVVAGATVAAVPLSRWFIAFSVFIFFSLAVAKRVTELQVLAARGAGRTPGRAYSVDDITPLLALGCASATASCLVYCLWASAPETTLAYRHPDLLLAALPLLLYWHARVWVFVGRRALEEDPVAFAMRDRVSLAVGAIFMLCIVAAH